MAFAMPEPNTGCWIWMGTLTLRMYGRIKVGGQSVPAHRFSCEHFNGPIPPGYFVCHRCDNPWCVNPAHLYAGTHLDNMRDRSARGRCQGPGHHRWGGRRRGDNNPNVKVPDALLPVIIAERRSGAAIRTIAARYGVSPTTIVGIVKGRRKA